MTPARKQRMTLLVLMIFAVGLAAALLLFALNQNINLFFTPSQVAANEAPVGQKARIGGLVVEGSVERDPDSLKVRFELTDQAENVSVIYEGILPDLFREGQGIVALGKLSASGVFEAEEVLAKHDENYMPPEVQEAIDKAHQAKS